MFLHCTSPKDIRNNQKHEIGQLVEQENNRKLYHHNMAADGIGPLVTGVSYFVLLRNKHIKKANLSKINFHNIFRKQFSR